MASFVRYIQWLNKLIDVINGCHQFFFVGGGGGGFIDILSIISTKRQI